MNFDEIRDILLEHGWDAFLVGGAVRDLMIGRVPKDFDIATNARPEDVMSLFPRSKKVGMHFPVVLIDGIEVATFRTEVATGRHSVEIKMVETIQEDLSRRDFTMNAIAMSIDKEFIDPFDGIQHIEDKIVKFVGDPIKRIEEDPLRMFRAVRFATTLNFRIEAWSLSAINNSSGLAAQVSHERIRDEFIKIIMSPWADRGMELLRQTDLLRFVSSELAATVGVGQNQHHGEDIWEHMIGTLAAVDKESLELRLAGLLHDIGKVRTKFFNKEKADFTFHGHEVVSATIAGGILSDLRFDNKTIERVVWLVREHMFFFNEDTRLSRVKMRMAAANELGLDIRDLMRIRIADRKGNKAKAHKPVITRAFKRTLRMVREVESLDAALTVKDLKINGSDLIEMGFKPGPAFQWLLKSVLEAVLEGKLENEITAQKRHIDQLVSSFPMESNKV